MKDLFRIVGALLLMLSLSGPAKASVFRIGGGLGYGGTGITANTDINPDEEDELIATVKRSTGPGMFTIFVEYILDENFSVSVEHFRGFDIAPFASGVKFTGGSLRYYITPPIISTATSIETTTLRTERINFYVGGSMGVALGEIVTENDLVETVSSSGIYLGGRVGSDYGFTNEIGLRGEVSYSFTFASAGENPSSMSQFGIEVGVFYMF